MDSADSGIIAQKAAEVTACRLKEREDQDAKMDQDINAAFRRNGVKRPKNEETFTPNSADFEAIIKLTRIGKWIESAAMPGEIHADMVFLFNLCQSLIFERCLLDEEIKGWKLRCDDLLFNYVASNIRKASLRLG